MAIAPDQLRARLRERLESAWRDHTPPLINIDIVGLEAIRVAHEELYQLIPPQVDLSQEQCRRTAIALGLVVEAHPELSCEAFHLESPTEEGAPRRAWFTFIRWGTDVLNPALEDAMRLGWRVGPEEREGRLFHLWKDATDHSALRIDPNTILDGIGRAVAHNIGEEPSLDDYSASDRRNWLAFLGEFGERASGEDIFEVEDDHLQVGQSSTSRLLREHVGAGARKERVFSLGQAQMDPRGMTADEILELRDLRDRVDAHRLIAELADQAMSLPVHSDRRYYLDLFQSLSVLMDVLDSVREPALHAAVIYEWSRRGRRGRHGGWTRAQVGAAYRVSAREVERRGDHARCLLRRAPA